MKIRIIRNKVVCLLAFLLFLSNLPSAYSQANAGQDKYLFKGLSVQLGEGVENPNYCYYWEPATGLDNQHILHPNANPQVTTTYTLTVVGPDFSSKATDDVKVNVVEFKVIVLNPNVCDGYNASKVRLDLVPASTPKAVLGTLSNLTLTSQTSVASQGNPAGTTTLVFSALNANYESTIANAIWYSTQANHCNVTSEYKIGANATVDGNAVAANPKGSFTVSTAFGSCLDGSASKTNDFSGSMVITTTQTAPNVFESTVAMGTFVRDMQANSVWTAWAISQYHDMVRDEEQFHEGQIEGTTSNILADLWDANLILTAIQANQPYIANTQAGSFALANAAFNTALTNERTRSSNLAFSMAARRCAVETEAKNAANSSHRVAMPCTYTACP